MNKEEFLEKLWKIHNKAENAGAAWECDLLNTARTLSAEAELLINELADEYQNLLNDYDKAYERQ